MQHRLFCCLFVAINATLCCSLSTRRPEQDPEAHGLQRPAVRRGLEGPEQALPAVLRSLEVRQAQRARQRMFVAKRKPRSPTYLPLPRVLTLTHFNLFFPQVCLEQCPEIEFLASNYYNYPSLAGVNHICLPNVNPTTGRELAQRVKDNKCAEWYMKTIAGKSDT